MYMLQQHYYTIIQSTCHFFYLFREAFQVIILYTCIYVYVYIRIYLLDLHKKKHYKYIKS